MCKLCLRRKSKLPDSTLLDHLSIGGLIGCGTRSAQGGVRANPTQVTGKESDLEGGLLLVIRVTRHINFH
jgi:hypothetical protein